jgi:Zn-dependent protease with chaperone function
MLKHPFNRIVADFSSNIISNLVTRGGALTALAKKALSDLLSKSYSRDKEFEADSYAVRLMYSAGFKSSAAKILLGRLKEHTPEDLPIYNYFLSHPSIDDRINKIDGVIKKFNLDVS